MVRTGANGPPRVRSRRADGVLFVLALVASSTLQGCLPPDWSFCDCDFRDNFWDSILNDVHLLWDGPDFVRKARDNRTFQGRYLQSPPSDLNCPVNPSVFWKAWPQYGITRGLIEGSMGDLWMPGARDRFKQVCIAGHLALMAICSQHFLVRSARAQEAGDPDHMKWLEASFGHMVAIRNLGQAYQIRQCMGQQGWSLDVGAFHKYTERWIGREAVGTVPQAAYFNGQVDPWQMLFTKPMHHNEESRAAALPDRRVCVPFKDPACWKRKSQLLIETCEYCCNPFQHKTGRGASWCWDDEWTYERCCQQDYKDLVCEVQRKGEEGGCVDCKKSVTYNCMTPPEKRLKDAQDNYNKKVDLFNSLQDKARTLAQDIAAARADLISKDATYQELHTDLNTKLRIWHVAFNNASRLLSAARLRQQELTWNNSNEALQQSQATLRSARGATSTAQATVAEARRQEQLGKQLLANNESAYAKAKSHHAATKEALTNSQDKRKTAETVVAEAEATLEAAKTTAKVAFETSLSANESSDATHRNTRKPLEEASSLRDALRATAWASQSQHGHFAALRTATASATASSRGAACQDRSVDTATTAARVRSAQRSVNEAAAVRNRSAEDLHVASKTEELFHQVLTNCTVGPDGSSGARCLIDVTPANKSAKPLLSKSSWRKELCNTWQAPHGCPDGQSCDCSIACDSEPSAQASEMRINALVQQMLETQRLAEQALARQRSKKDDFDEIEVYIPAELINAVEAATQKVASVKERQAAAAKDSREAQNMLEKAKSAREAADKKQRSAQDKLVQAQGQEKDLLSQLTAARVDLDRNMTSLQELRQHLAEANQTAQKASAMLADAIRREDWSKTLYHNLTKEASRKRQENNTEVLRRDEADKKVQVLNESLTENLTVLVSAWLRQQETAGEASHSARWSERLLAAAKAVLVNMVGSFESFLENYVISISDKDAAMQVMRAVEDLKAVELSALEAEKNAEDAAEQVRQAEGKVAEAEAARMHSDSKARNATSAFEEAKDVMLSAERLLNQTRVVVDTVGQQLQDAKVLVGKIKAEVDAAVSDHQKAVRAVELQADSVRTFQAVETLSAGQADQGLRIAELTAESQLVAGRLTQLEGKVKQIQSAGSTPSTTDGGRVPALIMGGWAPDTPASEVLQKANEMARDLQLQLNMTDAFVPGVRRGFVLIPLSPQDGESEEAMRQRTQACIRRVNSANVSLGRKADGNPAKLWLTVSQPPERRRRAALAGKVKRLIIEAGGTSTLARIEPEWATGTVWFRIAELLGVDTERLERVWGTPDLSRLQVVFLQEMTTSGGPHFAYNETWMLLHGKRDVEWRGCGVAFLKVLGHHESTCIRQAALCTVLKTHDGKALGLLAGHISHRFSIAQTAEALSDWGLSPTMSCTRVLLGFDANETLLQPGGALGLITLQLKGYTCLRLLWDPFVTEPDLITRIAREGGLPWEARLWLSLLEARELTFHVDKRQVRIEQSNGVRQGSPDSPVLFAAKIGEALDATLAAVNGGAPPHVGRHKALEPPPHSGAAFMDDTYVWGESPEYVQQVLAELEVRLRAIGLLINAKKTQVISNIDDDPFRFTIGGKTVKPDGPKTVMTILGFDSSPVECAKPLFLMPTMLLQLTCHRSPTQQAQQVWQVQLTDRICRAHSSQCVDRLDRKGGRRPGRAVVLTIAIMGTYLIYSGHSMSPATTSTSSSDEDSDMPLAPPETEEEIHGEGTTRAERQASTSPTWPCRHRFDGSSNAIHSKFLDLSAYGDDTDPCSRMTCHYPSTSHQNLRPPEDRDDFMHNLVNLDIQILRIIHNHRTGNYPGDHKILPLMNGDHWREPWQMMDRYCRLRNGPTTLWGNNQPPLKKPYRKYLNKHLSKYHMNIHQIYPKVTRAELNNHDLINLNTSTVKATCGGPASGNQDPSEEPAPTETAQAQEDEDDEWIEIVDDAEEIPPPAEEDEDGWISDVSDTEEEAGHGSQRVKNKARKSDVKKLWQEDIHINNILLLLQNNSLRRPQGKEEIIQQLRDPITTGWGDPATQLGTTSSQTDRAGDVLFTQPPHLTATASTPSSASGQPAQPDISDLEAQANSAVHQGRAPRWEIEDDTTSMRSSIRIGEVSFDISWFQGAGPPTLPPTIPIAPNVVFSARGTVAGSWRGVLWTPQQHETIRHPPRVRHEPSMVAYKTQSTAWRMGPTLSPGVTLTMYPVGEWIAVTRFELSFARTPRFWLVVVDAVPDSTQAGELPLQGGEQFFLEWQGIKREWVRRPRLPSHTDEGESPGIIVVFVVLSNPKGTSPYVQCEPADNRRSGYEHYDVNCDYDIKHHKDRGSESWIPEAAPQTAMELLQALTKVIHELLQASFSQPNEQVTILAYRACSYLTQIQALGPIQGNAPVVGGAPPPPPTAATFTLDNPLIEADATLNQLLQGHRDIPRRHLYNEMARVEQLLSDTKHMLAAWGKDPAVPGAHEGIAGIKNALDAMDWCHLAVEEGNIAQIEETLQIAMQATQRSRNYMDMLIAWIQRRFEDDAGSPPKRKRTTERATGSGESPVFVPQPQQPPPQEDPAPRRRGPEVELLPDQGHEDGEGGHSRPPLQRRHPMHPPTDGGMETEASPYAILRAQQLLKQALPFLEQELAVIVSQAYANLYTWTTAIWGHPIQLVDSPENEDIQQSETLLEMEGDTTPASQAETVMMPAHSRGRTPTVTPRSPRERQPSHRRRRLHAALANSSNDESD
ncbi:unnamed protein product [Symbiodinium necroappetens]|uniref:Reverse transcriptase domain-containing protein n=1 Tax=Symbiodinium necroappetens TaxID=1628268 RepID=A0A812THK1_9DINO|nr:unnamed protein product [Symbiodinium necroappetens]